ncbi:MAG TPA: glycosyltransferase family 9 protein [bacterium]|nr:glycosyltransferase family 9 protein [bacterium]
MRVLVIKIGAVGDVVMALSGVEAARDRWPNAHITWLCGRTVEPLLRVYGHVDEVIGVDDVGLLRGNLAEKIKVLIGVWARLFLRSFDLVVTGHSDRRYRWLSVTARAKERRGFDDRLNLVPGRYHGDEYARLILGQDYPTGRLFRPAPLRPSLDPELEKAIPADGHPLIAFAPGGAKNILRDDSLRRWPVGHYAELAAKLLAGGYQVVLTGAESDRWILEYFKGLGVVDLVGKTTVTDLIAVYGKCRLVVTHDSGPMHLAALAGARVLALFGPTIPSEKVPLGGLVHSLWGGEELPCRPCYDGRNYAKCSRNICLEDIGVERVLAEAKGILNAKD